MNDMRKAIKLYDMMAQRYEASGHGSHQAQVYREMVEFMGDCENVRQAHEKIKNSKYYLAPGAALLKDKLAALAKAASENDMADVAQVYEDKINEIDDRVEAMYEAGYERKAMNLKIPYLETLEAFGSLYANYLRLACGVLEDEVAMASAMKDTKESLAKLTKPSENFSVLAEREKFRQLIPVTDQGYEIFVGEMLSFIDQEPDFSQAKEAQAQEFAQAKEDLKREKSIVKEVGRQNLGQIRRSMVKVLAPDTKEGTYSYVEEEVKSFV